jgi:hypothetical protein
MSVLDFNDAYIFVDEKRNLLVMRKLGPLPSEINAANLSFIERQELRPVEKVITEEQLALTQEGKKQLVELKKLVIIKDAQSAMDVPGRYYLCPARIEVLKAIIRQYSQK